MEINELIKLLSALKEMGVSTICVDESSMMECVENDFRNPMVDLDCYDINNVYRTTIYLDHA